MPAEFSDPKFPSRSEGREVTRVKSTGMAVLQLNVMTKDMGHFGYSEPVNTGVAPNSDGFRVL